MKRQFSLAARHVYSDAAIKFNKLFKSDKKITLFQSAIGQKEENVVMHVSNRDDSSSLLNIGKNQTTIFPVNIIMVIIFRLDHLMMLRNMVFILFFVQIVALHTIVKI